MGRFRHTFTVNAGISDVAAFHGSTQALKKLSLPLIGIQFHRLEPLAENSISDFTMWIGPFPVRWVARHEEVIPDRGFVDVQESGPFQIWRHRHSFVSLNDSHTKVIDEIEYEYSRIPWWYFTGHLMAWNLPLTFAYRAWVTRKSLQKEPE